MPMTKSELEAFSAAIAVEVRDYIDERLAALPSGTGSSLNLERILDRCGEAIGQKMRQAVSSVSHRVSEIDDRLKALEARPPVAYGGVWEPEQGAKAGTFYTHRGSVWYCKQDTRERPGESPAFQLAVKAGRDGR